MKTRDDGKYFVAIDSVQGPFDTQQEAELAASNVLVKQGKEVPKWSKGRVARLLRQVRIM